MEHLLAWPSARGRVLAEVQRRIVGARVAQAVRGADHGLEYVLNDVAQQEIHRRESGNASSGEKKKLGEWYGLARRLGAMGDGEKQRRLEALVRDYAEDVVGNFDPRVYKLAKQVLPPVLTGLLSPQSLAHGLTGVTDLSRRIEVDGPGDALRTAARRGTLVVVPTHVSNLDSVVMGYSLDLLGLPPCMYGAGKNLWTNPVMGFFMRNLGAYRVDRRIKNAVYLDVLKEYATVLSEFGFHQMFFPGGTRSRSGAVERKLKLGLLGTAVKAYENLLAAGSAKRIYVVPASINLGITLEAETLIDDFLAEQGKQRYIIDDDESSKIGRVLAFYKKILALEGAVVIRYGRPLDPFGNAVDDDGESLDARGRRVDPATYLCDVDGKVVPDAQRDAEYTRQLGETIATSYQRLTVFLPTHLVARVIWDRLALAEGTRDVYRLLRRGDGFEVPVDVARHELGALRERIAARPAAGVVHARVQAMRPGDVIDDALRAFAGYHGKPAVVRDGERLIVRDPRLVVYYQNRTAHLGAA